MIVRDKWQDKIIDQLAFKYGLDKRVVREVVYYPLLFTNRVMNDPKDDRPIRIKHLGVFAYRGSRNKSVIEKPKYDLIIQHAEELFNIHYNEEFETLDHFVEYIIDLWNQREYSAIRKVHQIFKDKIKYAKDSKQKD